MTGDIIATPAEVDALNAFQVASGPAFRAIFERMP